MQSFVVSGGTPLYGSVRLGGAKNASFKLMIASLLSQRESRFLNFSRISEVDHVSNCIQILGGQITKRGERTLFINPTKLNSHIIPSTFGEASRSAPMFLPVLLHRFKKAVVPQPGGDRIGDRPIDWHLQALSQMGAKIIRNSKGLIATAPNGLQGATYRFPKNTHTGTETIIMAGVCAHGKTVIENAALEPEIDDLIEYLNNCGAHIRRRHHRLVEIEGVVELHGAIHQIMPDRNEAVSYGVAALITKGDVIVENAQHQYLESFLDKLNEIGAGYEIGQYGIRFYYKGPLKSADIETAAYPGFMTDWQPIWAVLATQLKGVSVIHETVYPSRFQYLEHLKVMGAKAELFTPDVSEPGKIYNFDYSESDAPHHHAVRFSGPFPLKAGEFTCRDLRHGATLALAALAAVGTSTLHNVEQIDRGYEDLDIRLNSIGAKIERIDLAS